jgi:Domain of unknown function (DUF4158)/Integrase core domain
VFRGDSYDNALAETVIGLFKTEVIRRRGPWRSMEAVEFATLEWVDWSNNRRLLEPIGNVPPADAEAHYYTDLEASALAAWLKLTSLRRSQGGSQLNPPGLTGGNPLVLFGPASCWTDYTFPGKTRHAETPRAHRRAARGAARAARCRGRPHPPLDPGWGRLRRHRSAARRPQPARLRAAALRYPGRLLRAGEAIPEPALRFVADQVGAPLAAFAAYSIRTQTRYQQLDALRAAYGFGHLTSAFRRGIGAWLLPIALATTSAAAVAVALLDEIRRRQLIVPGPSIVEELVAAAMTAAERHVARQLTTGLSRTQTAALDGLLVAKPGASTSVLA